MCIYIRNVNWSSKTWSTCTWGSFYVSFSIRRRYFRLFFFWFFNFFCYAFIYCVLVFPTSLVYIRYCLISVSIFSVVHHLPLYSSIRFLRFAPLRPQRPVAVFLSRYTLVPSVGRCYSKFLSLSRVPRALISGNGDERLRISYMLLVYLLLVSSKRHSLLCFYLLLFLPFFLCLFLYFHKKRLS